LAEEIQLAFAEDERAIRFVNREREWETLGRAGSAFGRSLAEFLQINEENKRETRDVHRKRTESQAESRMGSKSFPKQMRHGRVCTRRLLVTDLREKLASFQ
jgi:hypothetical protein